MRRIHTPPQQNGRPRPVRLGRAAVVCWLILNLTSSGGAQSRRDLTEISLENLLEVKITTVSKHDQKISETPAPVYVITQEDIQRFGFTSIPEALRLAPGMDVARVDGSVWAISARGFNKRYTNNMLVLIDGRTVYSHMFAGVEWDVEDLPMEDIERIEVIRGPGASIWGANAVNGIINVITKSARDTQGGLLTAEAGTRDRASSTVNWGSHFGKTGAYRVFSKYTNIAPLTDPATKKPSVDSSQAGSAGFRLDWGAGRDSFMASGATYKSAFAVTQSLTDLDTLTTANEEMNVDAARTHLLGRWSHAYSDHSNLEAQMSVQSDDRLQVAGSEHYQSGEFELQQRFVEGAHQIILGGGIRRIWDRIEPGLRIAMTPERGRIGIWSVFSQDTISLPGRFKLTAGAKIEDDTYSSAKFEPDLRLLWTATSRQMFWASASYAVGATGRVYEDAHINLGVVPPQNSGPKTLMTLDGNTDLSSTSVTAFGLGHRYQPHRRFLVESTVFHNTLEDLLTRETGPAVLDPSGSQPHLVIPMHFGSEADGQSYGAESNATWTATSRWKLTGSYSYLRIHTEPFNSTDPNVSLTPGRTPNHQFQARSAFDLPHNVQFDSALYFTGRMETISTGPHARLDAHLGWKATESTALSVFLQDAFNRRQVEFLDNTGTQSTVAGRALYARLQWRF